MVLTKPNSLLNIIFCARKTKIDKKFIMRIDKNISVDGYNLLLSYNDLNTDPELINQTNCRRLIMAIYFPNENESESEINAVFDKLDNYLKAETKKVVEENKSFYDHFDVSFVFDEGGYTALREMGKKIITEAHRYLKIKLKETKG